MDELPKFNETFGPILKILAEGETIQHRELIKKVQSEFYADLSEELLDLKTKSGDRLLNNRIAWGKSYLKKGGFVHYPKRGLVQITEKGKRAAKLNLDLKEETLDFFPFYTEEDKKDKELPDIEDSSPQDLILGYQVFMEGPIKSPQRLPVRNIENQRRSDFFPARR